MSVCKIKGTQFIKQRQLRAERGGIRGKKKEKNCRLLVGNDGEREEGAARGSQPSGNPREGVMKGRRGVEGHQHSKK